MERTSVFFGFLDLSPFPLLEPNSELWPLFRCSLQCPPGPDTSSIQGTGPNVAWPQGLPGSFLSPSWRLLLSSPHSHLKPNSFFFLIEIQLIYNVVLITAVQQSDSVIHIYILCYILFHYGLSHVIEYSS